MQFTSSQFLSDNSQASILIGSCSKADDDEAKLFEIMKSSGISKLYEKFRKAEITADIIWKLSDEMLEKDLKLNGIEKLQYKTAKENNDK